MTTSIKQPSEKKKLVIERAAAAAELKATTTVLHKVLPPSIADRLIAGELDIADNFPSVSILFADIVGFTPISARMPAAIVVRFLNHVFGEFDRIMKKHGCEKIKTIGDGYMAVAGAPIPCDDHAERMALAALEMQEDIRLPEEFMEYLPAGTNFGIRIGLHTGSVVGGVIGDERFVYDIYSDSVNTAARMESHGEQDKIHVSEEFLKELFMERNEWLMDNGEWLIEEADDFSSLTNTHSPLTNTHSPFTINNLPFTINHSPLTIIPRGEMAIKGKGMMKTYFLEKATL